MWELEIQHTPTVFDRATLDVDIVLLFMAPLGDRLVIMVIVVTGLAGLFAWWSGFIEGALGGWEQLFVRGFLVLLFVLIIVFVWQRFRGME